ncbi:PH domain-containing protein [Cellulomonas sp. URHE0023]|uniref:PH domain-containing protein n=1 Tax=Cellulomonas sp. URHE0023 TaxID=1380354 RepID=UPI00069113E0|nr:PH domain-containing protein [Cellulomonas sp. URHE0023]
MAGPSQTVSHPTFERYLVPEEHVVLAVRLHWAKVIEPVLTAVAVFVAIGWLVGPAAQAFGDGAELLWWIWIAVLVRSAWLLASWRAEWFVTTDRRMLLVFGLLTRKVAMMPLGKVTDMNYKRSPLGLLLGYGEFVLESAGQDQAMRSIRYVRHPDDTYRAICAVIFAPQNAEPQHRPASPARPPVAPPPSYLPTWPPAPSSRPSDDVTQLIPARRIGPVDADDDVGPGWDVSETPSRYIDLRTDQSDGA